MYLNSKGANIGPLSTQRLDVKEELSISPPQEEFQTISLQDSLQHSHDVVVLSAVNEANQLV